MYSFNLDNVLNTAQDFGIEGSPLPSPVELKKDNKVFGAMKGASTALIELEAAFHLFESAEKDLQMNQLMQSDMGQVLFKSIQDAQRHTENTEKALQQKEKEIEVVNENLKDVETTLATIKAENLKLHNELNQVDTVQEMQTENARLRGLYNETKERYRDIERRRQNDNSNFAQVSSVGAFFHFYIHSKNYM